jgi:signal transduction histidine kinase
MLSARNTIGARIFGGFVAMSCIVGALGFAGYAELAAVGEIAVTTFDGPLMAISYGRAAHTDFAQLQAAELRLEHAPAAERAQLLAEIGDINQTFESDLDVVAHHATEHDERALAAEIAPLMRRWNEALRQGDNAALQRLSRKIDSRFDMLVELITDHGFISRRQAVSTIAHFRYTSIAITILAVLLSVAITLWLRNRIVKPLAAAAAVAGRIAQGELQTAIPEGGKDETGALLKSMAVMQDGIRDMMARETRMRLSAENRLADALETSREGVLLADAGGSVVLANGPLRGFFPAVAESLVPGIRADTALRLLRGQLASGSEGDAIAAPGRSELQLAGGRWLRMSGSPTSEGGTIWFLTDITALKEREETLRRATREAEAANASKTRFLANMSHELRTPLNAIIGFSEIMTKQLFGPLGNPKYSDYAADVLRSGRHLLTVINDVLDLSKSEAGKMTLHATSLDMCEVLNDCLAMVREQCAAAGLTLDTAFGPAPLMLEGDGAKLRQIFLNLLSNAIKFTETGGRVAVAAAAEGGDILVTVTDTGIGMSPEDLEIAFRPFSQVDNRLERRYEGTGLGLPLTKALVDLHGGHLTLQSAPGRGTCARVRFVRAAAAATARAG